VRRPRLALIHPRFRYPSGDPPLGLAGLAAWVRRELPVQVAIHDGSFQPGLGPARRFLDRYRPHFVGIGASTLMLPDTLELAGLAHQRGARVVLGGPHPSLFAHELLGAPPVDAVIRGEGEQSLVALLERWLEGDQAGPPPAGVSWRGDDGAILHGPDRPPLEDLDRLPFPAWELLEMRRYLRCWGKLEQLGAGLPGTNLSAARGCPHRCSFCQPTLRTLFGPRLRQRSPDHIIEELRALKRRYGVQGFWFTDDTFSARPAWTYAFCEAYRRSGLGLPWGCTSRADALDGTLLDALAEAGLARLGLGLEAASDRIREGVYAKGVTVQQVRDGLAGARDRGIHGFVFLMLGAPGERLDEMVATIHTAARLPAHDASFSLCVPLPGTALHQQLLDQGVCLSSNPQHYDYYARQPFSQGLPPWFLRGLQYYGWARFHLEPGRRRALLRSLTHPGGWRARSQQLRRLRP
jgi:anaerobic magnesium-protoporphyrin IX monomethyl ester cyclase